MSVLAAISFALIVAFGAPTSVACADDSQDARVLFEAGVAATRAERWQDARDSFKRSIALVPKASSLLNLAVAEVQLQLFADALKTLDAFDALASAEHGALIERAQALRVLATQGAQEESERAQAIAAPTTSESAPKPEQATDPTSAQTSLLRLSPRDGASQEETSWRRVALRSTWVAAGVFGAAAVGGGIGWRVMNGKLEDCDSRSPSCSNRDDVVRDRERAVRVAYATGAVALSLAITATAWLLRERRKTAVEGAAGGLRFQF